MYIEMEYLKFISFVFFIGSIIIGSFKIGLWVGQNEQKNRHYDN